MSRNLNNTNFKLMVYLALVFALLDVSWLVVTLVSHNGNISPSEGKSIDSISFFIIFALSIVIFRRDLVFLKENNAYCPAWGWYFFFPVYMYKRQKNNNLGLSYFWVYMVCTFILAKVLMQLSLAVILHFLIA